MGTESAARYGPLTRVGSADTAPMTREVSPGSTTSRRATGRKKMPSSMAATMGSRNAPNEQAMRRMASRTPVLRR